MHQYTNTPPQADGLVSTERSSYRSWNRVEEGIGHWISSSWKKMPWAKEKENESKWGLQVSLREKKRGNQFSVCNVRRIAWEMAKFQPCKFRNPGERRDDQCHASIFEKEQEKKGWGKRERIQNSSNEREGAGKDLLRQKRRKESKSSRNRSFLNSKSGGSKTILVGSS